MQRLQDLIAKWLTYLRSRMPEVPSRAAEEPPQAKPEPPAGPCWTLSSDTPSGSKVCTVRQGNAHLFHAGVGSAWSPEEVEAFLADCLEENGRLPEGTMLPPSAWPAQITAWGEALRFAQDEVWGDLEFTGTTIVGEVEGEIWVLTRGGHLVQVREGAPDSEPTPGEATEWGGALWRLPADRAWTVEVGLEEGVPPIWTAHWRDEADRLRRVHAAAAAAEAPAPPRRPLPAWVRRAAVAGGAVAAVALLFVLPLRTAERIRDGWIWTTEFLSARYRVTVTSYPAGAAILVDGVDTGVETPAELELTQGSHRVLVTLGAFGATEVTVEGHRAQRLERHVELLGSLIVGVSDTNVQLQARLDGRPIGNLPTRLDSVPAGRRHLSFHGREVRPWTEEVDVVAGKITQITAHPELVPEDGVVFARSFEVNAGGLTEVHGAAVYLDGRRVGYTPARLTVPRGYHTVRLARGSESSPVQLLRVEGGGELYATAEFGRSPEPRVTVDAPERASLESLPEVRASLESASAVRVRDVYLYWRVPGGEFERSAMRLGADVQGLGGSMPMPADSTLVGKWAEFFVLIETDQGEEFVSEVQTVRVVK